MKDLIRKIDEIIEDAKPGRAWSGKLKRIYALLAWMYDKNILSKSEKNKKDSLFNQYNRYYNDGDFPRVLSAKGLSKYADRGIIEKALETELETYIKTIIGKYMPKVNRTEFRKSQMLAHIALIEDLIGREDPHGLLYFIKDKGIQDEGILDIAGKLSDAYNKRWKDTADKVIKSKDFSSLPSYDRPSTNLTFSNLVSKLKANNLWNNDLQTLYKEIKGYMIDIEGLYTNLKQSITMADELNK